MTTFTGISSFRHLAEHLTHAIACPRRLMSNISRSCLDRETSDPAGGMGEPYRYSGECGRHHQLEPEILANQGDQQMPDYASRGPKAALVTTASDGNSSLDPFL